MTKKEKIPRTDYIDSRYKQLMEKKPGKKLIQIMRLLTDRIMTVQEIKEHVDFSESEIKKLINRDKERFVQKYVVEKIKGPGRPVEGSADEKVGRPPYYYGLTEDGLWLIRFDPEVRDRWSEIEKTYEKRVKFTPFNSYANLIYALGKHSELKKYQKPYYFMDQELQRSALNPFIYVGEHDSEKVIQLYDELVDVIKANIISEDVENYYSSLAESYSRLQGIIYRHKLLMEKMGKLPEVQEYIREDDSKKS